MDRASLIRQQRRASVILKPKTTPDPQRRFCALFQNDTKIGTVAKITRG